jgi:PhoPQ-activated pathogenicity-related protein
MLIEPNGRLRVVLPGALLLAMLALVPRLSANEAIPTSLQNYVSRAEDVYAWQLRAKQATDLGTVYDIDLTSQRWQGIVWQHALHVYEPADLGYRDHVLLFITGGANGRRPGEREVAMGLQLATLARARVAMLYQVPNQPLFEGRVEDDLITETWLRYLETGDENWPLLFPMVKSAVKAMDAIEEMASTQWQATLRGFVITGGSKRGWTSWLTPVADKRVLATAPLVIDVLNFKPQMQHQLDTWGKYSEQIHDYTSKGLIKINGESARETRLRLMMDPYTYRQALTLPKLIVNGTNDRYWVLDATRFYWDDLVGPKYVLKVPNAGHGLDAGRELALRTVAAFFQHVADGSTWPAISWQETDTGKEAGLRMTSSVKPVSARFWRAESESKDFREARWVSEPMEVSDDLACTAKITKPAGKHLAYFGEMEFRENGLPYSLSTLVFVDY